MDRTAQHMCSWGLEGSWFGGWGRRLLAPLGLRRRQTLLPERHSNYQGIDHVGYGGVGFGAGVCIAINLVMGSGFLALPKAFVSAGLILGAAVTLACMVLLGITAGYEAEVMCRAEAWANANVLPLTHNKGQVRGGPDSQMRLSTHAFQVSEMCEMFGGRKLQRAYNVLLFLCMFCALWGYAAVFGEALATYAPLPFLGYTGAFRLYVALFGAVVVPLSCTEIKEQALFQVLANNAMATIYDDHVDSANTDPVVVTTFRMACAVPPLLCALLFRDFAAIVGYGGKLAIMIAFVIPAYLNLISQKMCEERFGSSRTPFTGDVVSSSPVLYACMVLGALLFVVLVGNNIASSLGGSI